MKKGIGRILIITFMGIFFSACARNSEPKQQEIVQEKQQEEIVVSRKNLDENVVTLKNGKVQSDLEPVGKDNPYYCNLEENMRGELNSEYEVLLCKDPVYDVVYYVDYGRDYYIYVLRDGVSELAVEIPARSLYCRNGELYFMAESYGIYEFEGIAQGNILKYNPLDGTVSVVIDKNATRMVVYPDEICYEIVEKAEAAEDGSSIALAELCHFFFEKEAEENDSLSSRSMERWKGNYFVEIYEVLDESDPTVQELRNHGITDEIFGMVGVKLVSPDRSRESVLKDTGNVFEINHWIYGDELYYIGYENELAEDGKHYELIANYLMAYHLSTGEHRVVTQLNVSVNYYSDDFVIVNDVVYFGNLLRVSLSDGEQSVAQVIGEEKPGQLINIDAFYTDGNGGLYGLYNGKIWSIEETKNVDDWPIEREGLSGLYVTQNGYRYQLVPIGGKEG